jgi:hypothetical protein
MTHVVNQPAAFLSILRSFQSKRRTIENEKKSDSNYFSSVKNEYKLHNKGSNQIDNRIIEESYCIDGFDDRMVKSASCCSVKFSNRFLQTNAIAVQIMRVAPNQIKSKHYSYFVTALFSFLLVVHTPFPFSACSPSWIEFFVR